MSMDRAFQIVYELLLWTAAQTGLTYYEVNIVVYYGLVPLAFLLGVDWMFRTWVCSLSFVFAATVFLLMVPDFTRFSEELFKHSVVFLQGFSHVGWKVVDAGAAMERGMGGRDLGLKIISEQFVLRH